MDCLVEALHTLLMVTPREDPFFLAHGLELLVKNMAGDLAYLVMVEGDALETQWWFPENKGGEAPPYIPSFCRWLLENPFRTLVLRDIATDEHWKDDPELIGLDLGAAAGAVLWEGGHVKGLVFVHYAKAHAFTRAELALLDAVAGFLGRILEVEDLKSSLSRLENALAITKAVVEDSSLQDPATKLPNLRYLDIWLKANLNVAATREEMTVAEWLLPIRSPEELIRIRETAEWIRGGDLLVSEGKGRFMLILQRTRKGLGHIFLLRLRHKLGELPMGATVWVPGADDTHLESVRVRLESAVEESRRMLQPSLVWRMPE
jgi:hypothetical protein